MASLKYFRYAQKVNFNSWPVSLTKSYSQSATEALQENVNYPPILDATEEGNLRNERQKFYDHVRSLPTVEEKQSEITSLYCNKTVRVYSMSSAAVNYNGAPFQQYITRTHLIRGLPQKYQETNVDETLNFIQPHLYRMIALHMKNRWKTGEIWDRTATIELISMMYRMLSFKHTFLSDSVLDVKGRTNAYWWHGGFASKQDKLDEKNICFQYNGNPDLAVRIETPLTPIVPLDDPLCASADVPNFHYHPSFFGLPFQIRRFITSVPGFWPGDCCEYPCVSFHSKQHIAKLKARIEYAEASTFPTIEDGFGIMSSFGWLVGTATNLGFTPFHDVTYPLVTQTVLTDGQDWHFFVYQLNTMCFHSDVDCKNKRNICWSSGKLRLFESLENNELKGLNDNVFRILLQFFLNLPQVPAGVALKPYLSTCTKSAEEFSEIKTRLKKMFSNKPDPKAHMYEVPLWQHIYKWHRLAPASPQVKLK